MGNSRSVPSADVARPVERSDTALDENVIPLDGMVGSDGELILSERGKEEEEKRREIEEKQRNGRPWIKPLDRTTSV